MSERRSKYNARKVHEDGYTFDSIQECYRYRDLVLMEKAGAISNLVVHPVFLLQENFKDAATGKRHRAITYEGDFQYLENGATVVEDVKGKPTDMFRLKWKMFRFHHPNLDARIVK